MNRGELNKQARRHYYRFYRLMVVAVVVMTAVLTGSVVLGDSVRDTLVHRVVERFGSAQTVISSGHGMLNDSILRQDNLRDAHGYLIAEGFVSSEGKMLPVMVWGTDEDGIGEGGALINETLQKNLGRAESLVVHLPSNSMVPSGSLFISQRYTTTMRLTINGIKTTDEGGNRWLHNEQMRPMNVFVNRREMADVMGVEGRVNLILSDKVMSEEKFKQCWSPAYSGVRMVNDNTQSPTITSERVFLSQNVVEALHPEVLYNAYFVNKLGKPRSDEGTIPYSFVTATSQLKGDDAVLSDVAARRMGIAMGDSVEMEYYVVRGLKRLATRRHRFVVKDIVPLSTFMDDERLKADFPGLSNVERCTDWDSDLPIDMSKIGKEDEDYWAQYRQTPKAIVAWEAVKDDWSNAYGVATSITLEPNYNPQLSALTPDMMGIMVISPREELMQLAGEGTDFGSLFLALAFFIVVAAILLMLNPLTEMYHLRRDELQMYELLGFDRYVTRKILFWEAMPLLCVSSLMGVLVGCCYATLSLWLLSGAWRGATHTEDFTLHLHPLTVGGAWLTALLIGVGVLWMAFPARKAMKGGASRRNRRMRWGWLSAGCAVLVLLLLLNFFFFHSMVLFVVCGLLWIACAGGWGQWWVNRQENGVRQKLERKALWWSALTAHLPRHRVAFWTLSTGVFMVFAVGLNRPDIDHFSSTATGGYEMYAECRVPIQYDLNNLEVRHHLKLDEIGDHVRFLQMQRHREDEASCLNLNRVATPSVLAMDVKDMASFGVDTTVFTSQQSTLNPHSSTLIPVVLDEESLMWSVMKSVGDTLQYVADDGRTVSVLIAGSYPMGVLHGHVLMTRQHFNQLWPEESGSSVLMATEDVGEVVTTVMAEYGVDTMSVVERMAQFFEVTDTYLSIFMALGGLGLLLGIVSLMVVVRKHVVARRQEIALYDVLGFSPTHIVHLLRMENALPALYAILIGAVGSVISISASMSAVHWDTWLVAMVLLLLFLLITILLINHIINLKTIKK